MIRGDKNHLVDNIVHTEPIHFISASQICTVGLPRTGLHNKTEPYGGGGFYTMSTASCKHKLSKFLLLFVPFLPILLDL